MPKKHLLLALLVTAVWGINFPITKRGLTHIDPLLLTAIRFTLTALPWVCFIKRPNIARRWIAAYGLIFGVAMWALINLGIAMGVPPGTASLLIQFSAFFTMGWGVLLFRDGLTVPQLIGMGFAGMGLIGILLASPGRTTTIGFLLVLTSAMAWSIGNVIIKASKVREIFAFIVWASLAAPIPLFVLTWMLHGAEPFITFAERLNKTSMFSLAFQVYGATHFCYWGWNRLLRDHPASKVAPLSLLIPVFGTLSSVLIIHETPSTADCISMASILLALAIGLKKGGMVLVRPGGCRRSPESPVGKD